MTASPRSVFFVFVTLLGALTLMILPMPAWAEIYRPQWLTLVLVYWCLVWPERFGVFSGFGVGLTHDVISGGLLGAHALSLSVVAYMAEELHRRVRAFPVWQQALVVWMLLLLERLLSLWAQGAIGQPTPTLVYWVPSFIGLLLWPWLWVFLNRLRTLAGAV